MKNNILIINYFFIFFWSYFTSVVIVLYWFGFRPFRFNKMIDFNKKKTVILIQLYKKKNI